jgi:hypothetical protein
VFPRGPRRQLERLLAGAIPDRCPGRVRHAEADRLGLRPAEELHGEVSAARVNREAHAGLGRRGVEQGFAVRRRLLPAFNQVPRQGIGGRIAARAIHARDVLEHDAVVIALRRRTRGRRPAVGGMPVPAAFGHVARETVGRPAERRLRGLHPEPLGSAKGVGVLDEVLRRFRKVHRRRGRDCPRDEEDKNQTARW